MGVRLVSLCIFVLLTHLLQPEAFGQLALVAAVYALSQTLIDTGIGAALIQRPSLEPEALTAGMALAAVIGAAAALATAALSPLFDSFFDQPDLLGLFLLSAPLPLIYAAGSGPRALLARRLHFRSLALRTLAASLVGGGTALVAVLAGLGAASLVLQLLAGEIAALVVVWLACRDLRFARFNVRHCRSFVRFGTLASLTSVVSTCYRRGDDVLIGRFLDTATLGIYSVAYRLLLLASEVLSGTVTQVTLPVLARHQGDARAFRDHLRRALGLSTAVGLPVFAALYVGADDVVKVVFGDEWSAAGPVLAGLSIWGAVDTVGLLSSTAMLAKGQLPARLYLSLLRLVFLVAAFALTFTHGITAIAYGLALSLLLFQPLEWIVTTRLLPFSFLDYVRGFLPALVATVAAAGAATCVLALAPLGVGWPRLVVIAAVGLPAYIAASLLLQRHVIEDARIIANLRRPSVA